MSSLIDGYNYDIFISYRQKDNKGDRWVSEFVEALKTELESTFKEEISVYFDINPHDGLLETHDVSESLKEKLKCLIFIPIISRTYCDPKSFAWEHEFKAFVEMASKDQFGLKVKLPNGNVASRVLPIRIHDLDSSDIKECESLLGTVLRGIEFIYREPGVNKPLISNLNINKYGIHINKTANAIREILEGLRNNQTKSENIPVEFSLSANSKSGRKTLMLISLFILIGISVGLTLILNSKKDAEKSIAVIPFIDDGEGDESLSFILGVHDEIITNLQTIKSFSKVMPRISVDKYTNSGESIHKISRELGVNFIVSGSGERDGNTFRVKITLLNSRNKVLWSKPYTGTINKKIETQIDIANTIASELKLVVLPEEKRRIDKSLAYDNMANDYFQLGRGEHIKYWINQQDTGALQRSRKNFKLALKYDSTFAKAYSGLAMTYLSHAMWWTTINKGYNDTLLLLCNTALSYDDELSEAHTLKGVYFNSNARKDLAVEEFDKGIKLNPNDFMAYWQKGMCTGYSDWITTISCYEKAASLTSGIILSRILYNLGDIYIQAGFADKAQDILIQATSINTDSAFYYQILLNYNFALGNLPKVLKYLKRLSVITGKYYGTLGSVYSLLHNGKDALKCFNNSSSEPHRKAWALKQNGFSTQADSLLEETIQSYENQTRINPNIHLENSVYYDLACAYSLNKDRNKAIENLKIFSESTPPLSMMTYIKNEPAFDDIRNDPEFQQIVDDLENKFNAEHERVRKWISKNKNTTPYTSYTLKN